MSMGQGHGIPVIGNEQSCNHNRQDKNLSHL